ncbi:MAG: hypothetical protein M0C28_46275 [Candidatus Moduliflexus flocculans]|nr:hypothetical protein [Candidatus Moduliflexus flocculans]
MGWYPWNIFGEEPQNEKLIKEIADALVASGTEGRRLRLRRSRTRASASRAAPTAGSTSRTWTAIRRACAASATDIHAKGLKYALYTDAGTKTCSQAMPGTKGHEFEDMRAFADWRADYIKIDWCNSEGQDIVETVSRCSGKAQRAAGPSRRPQPLLVGRRLSLDVGAAPSATCGGRRPTSALRDSADWARALRIAFANEKLAGVRRPRPLERPGHDDRRHARPDRGPEPERSSASGAMMASPLIAGNDLRGMTTVDDRHPDQPRGHRRRPGPAGRPGPRRLERRQRQPLGREAPLRRQHGRPRALSGQARAERKITWEELGFKAADELYVRDLWTHETSGPHAGELHGLRRRRRRGVSSDFEKPGISPIPPIIVADTYLASSSARPEPVPKSSPGRSRS